MALSQRGSGKIPSPLPACKASTAGRIASSMVRSPAPAPLYRETAAAPAAAAAAQPDGVASPAEQPPNYLAIAAHIDCRSKVRNTTPASWCLHRLRFIIVNQHNHSPSFPSRPPQTRQPL